MKLALGFLIAFLLGAACRWLDIPAPAPPMLAGALLIVAVTLGYTAVDRYKARQHPPTPASIRTSDAPPKP